MLKRVGLYSWAGPGTERIIKIKYFSPKIDRESLFHAYDFEYLKKLQDTFGITDAWISYSWGFSESKEKVDYAFTLNRLQNFKRLGIKTHAYIQGCNLVYEDFKSEDFWCRDEKDRLITYYKGRKVACVNNPNFFSYFEKKLVNLCKHPFDGIYVDNIQMGQLGIPMQGDDLPFVFAGCKCTFCEEKFQQEYNIPIPSDFELDRDITKKFLEFRVSSLENFVQKISKIVHSHNKLFSTNSYDPKFNTKYVYGFDVVKLQKYQDYIFFENHAFANDSIDNRYIDNLKLRKPVFVVSYKKGIGFEKQYTQQDFDHIFSEAVTTKFFPVLKASEFTTNGIWHNLHLENLKKPNISILKRKAKNSQKQSKVLGLLQNSLIRRLAKSKYNQSYTLIMENRFMRPLITIVYELVLH
jgi:hypothetical protein